MGFSRQEYWSGLPFPSPEAEASYLPEAEGKGDLSLDKAKLFFTKKNLPVFIIHAKPSLFLLL